MVHDLANERQTNRRRAIQQPEKWTACWRRRKESRVSMRKWFRPIVASITARPRLLLGDQSFSRQRRKQRWGRRGEISRRHNNALCAGASCVLVLQHEL